MTFKLEFETDDDALAGDNEAPEACRILHEIAEDVANGSKSGGIWDINGNKIGQYELQEAE